MILHGENLIIKVDGTVIAAAKSCTVSVETKLIPTSSPSDGEWTHAIPGRKSWSVRTNHLVTDIISSKNMVNQEVTLGISNVVYENQVFTGFVNTDSVIDGEAFGNIYFNTATNKFIVKSVLDRNYYSRGNLTDEMTSPSVGELFGLLSNNGQAYRWNGTTLVEAKLSGTAICRQWEGTFTKGSLAQGSFIFQGTGALG